jgi:hypothetical protein
MSSGITSEDFDRIREYLNKRPHLRRPDDLIPADDEGSDSDEK